MRYRAKLSKHYPYPIWVKGEYITDPPIRPCDGVKRPKGHYIDSGGYPGANVSEINTETLCRESNSKDLTGKAIFEKDFLRFDYSEQEQKILHAYCIAEFGRNGKLDIIDFLTGEILEPQEESKMKVIGNLIDNVTFIEDLQRVICESKNAELPYIPMINVQMGSFPYWRITCRKCGHATLGAVYKTTCLQCGGTADCTLATEYKKESVSV